MKKGYIFPRVVALLLIGVWASTILLTGTGTLAKYAAGGNGSANARVAAFSFVAGANQFKNGAFESTAGNPLGLPHGVVSWTEIVTPDGIGASTSQTFALPLFDCEYASTPSRAPNSGNTLIGGISVCGAGLVAAPGTGHGGAPKHNTNVVWDTTDSDIASAPSNASVIFSVHNQSEVTLRFKIEYDPENSLLPVVDASTGAVAVKKPEAGDLTLPIAIRGYGCNNAGSFRLDEWTADKGPKNLYLHRAGTAAYAGFTLIGGDAWLTLAPGQYTGQASPAINNIGVVWIWGYAVDAPAAFTLAQPSLPDHFYKGWGYATWVDAVAAAGNYPQWEGFYAADVLPHLPDTRAGNIDRFDTVLGLAAAKGDLNISLAFRITVEQVD